MHFWFAHFIPSKSWCQYQYLTSCLTFGWQNCSSLCHPCCHSDLDFSSVIDFALDSSSFWRSCACYIASVWLWCVQLAHWLASLADWRLREAFSLALSCRCCLDFAASPFQLIYLRSHFPSSYSRLTNPIYALASYHFRSCNYRGSLLEASFTYKHSYFHMVSGATSSTSSDSCTGLLHPWG